MATDHDPRVKHPKQHEALRRKGLRKARADRVANAPDASDNGTKAAGSKAI